MTHLGVVDCSVLFLGHCDLDVDLSSIYIYSNRVRSISPILNDIEIPNLIWEYILRSWNVAYCLRSLWPGPLDSDLKIVSKTYILHYLRKQSQVSWVDASRCWRLQRTILGHCRLDLDLSSIKIVYGAISSLLHDIELPNFVYGCIFGPWCVKYSFWVTVPLTSGFSSR